MHRKFMKNFVRHSGNQAQRFGRNSLVFLKKASDEDAPMNQEEFRISEAVGRASKLAENVMERQGFLQLGDHATDSIRLGIRRSASKVIPKLLDERVTQRFMKEVFPEERKEETGWGINRKVVALGTGFFGKVKNLLKSNDQKRFEETFSYEKTIPGMSMRLAHGTLYQLNDTQRVHVQQALTNLGIALPAAPATPPAGYASTLHFQQTAQLASATPEQLLQMRDIAGTADPDLLDMLITRGMGPVPELFAARQNIPPLSPFERMLQFKKIEGQERHEMVASTVYDPQRLQNLIRDLEVSQPDLHHVLLHDVLEHDALFKLENNPEALALVHYLESRLGNPNSPDLKTELDAYVKKLKDIKIKESDHGHGHGHDHAEPGKEKPEDAKKKIEEANELVMQKYGSLNDMYSEAAALGKELFDESLLLVKYNQTLNNLATTGAGGGGGRGGGGNNQQASSAQSYKELIKDTKATITAKQASKKQMFTSIREAESGFLKGGTDLKKLLEDNKALPAVASPDPIPNLRIFLNSIIDVEPDRSKELGLFGKTTAASETDSYVAPEDTESPLRVIFRDTFKPENLKKMKKEINDECLKIFKKKTTVKPFELLHELMVGEAIRAGVTNPAMAGADALAAADVLVANAGELLQVHRSTNLEHQQWLSSGQGKMSRAKQWVSDWYKDRKVYRAEELIDYIAGLPGSNYKMFHGMSKDISEQDIIDRINRSGNIRDPKTYEALYEYSMKLREAYLKFEKLNDDKKIEYGVELDDRDARSMERLINKLLKVRSVLRSMSRYEKINTMHGDKGEIVLNMLRDEHEKSMHDEKSIFERIKDKAAEWKTYFSKKVLKDKFLNDIYEKRKEVKEGKMSNEEFEHSIQKDGLVTAYNVLRGILAAKEAYDIAKGGAKLAGKALSHTKSGAGKVASFGTHKVAKPVLKNLVVRPIVWTVGTAAKIVKAPFVLVGNIVGGMWKWASTPSKGGGHGGDHGGGHGGGHH